MKKSKKIVLIVLAAVIVLAAAGAGAAWYYYQSSMKKMRNIEAVETDSPSHQMASLEDEGPFVFDAEVPQIEPPDPDSVVSDSNIINILLVGLDDSKHLSDTMIVCSINKEKKDIKLTSFMRDTYVQINNSTRGKLNASYSYGGIALLNSALQRNFGVVVDANVIIDFDGFMYAISQVGDVEIEINEAEAKHLNDHYAQQYGWHIEPGLQTLNPQQLLEYSRIRHVGYYDFERTERQRRVLTAAFNKVKTMSIFSLIGMVDRIIPYVQTDLETSQIIDLVKLMFVKGDDGKAMEISETFRIPVDGKNMMVNGQAVLQCNMSLNQQEFYDFVYGE